MHKIKRADRPTTLIHESEIERTLEDAHGINRALRGDFGPFVQKERMRFATKYPLSAAL
jgi:hypothetical protein